ncbi:TDT family transporter [Streptomyces sp. NPDC058305]|uniref:SLAC1 family transporter n=1 Tax=Streptomyces sp. NPDC058305 TaxID=3346438 RepID=UPI0036EC6CE4
MMVAPRIPLNFFGMPFGLAGLAELWVTVGRQGHAPDTVADVLLAVAALVWLSTLVGYLRYVAGGRGRLMADLTDTVAGPFASLALITPMLLAAQGLAPHAESAGRIVVDVFIVLTVLLGGWLTGQWIYGPLVLDHLHPGYFLPTVAGGLLAAASAAEVGQQRLAQVMLGLGLVCWLILGSMILARLLFRPRLATPLVPTLAIEVAPAAVASLAYFAIDGDRVDAFAAGLAGYGLLMVLAQLRLLPLFRSLKFTPSTWSFTFSWAAVGAVTLHWIESGRPGGHLTYTYLVLAAVSALVGAVAVRTLIALGRRQLLPKPPPQAAGSAADN